MIGNNYLRIRNDKEAIHQITGLDYPEIRNFTRANGQPIYVLPYWVQIPEKVKLESAGFTVGRTVAGGTSIHD